MSLQPLDDTTKTYFETRGQVTPPAEPPAEPVQEVAPVEPPQEPQEPTEENKGQFVRLGALHEERAKRRELERQLQELLPIKERYSKLESRTEEILRRMQEDQAPQIPEWEKDPLGHTKTRIETQEERLARLEREEEQRREMAQHQSEYMQFRNVVAQHTHQFMAKTPDYAQAYQHLMTMQAEALQEAGFPPEQIRVTLEQYETAIARKALEDGVNPAERAYAMAKKMGYKGAPTPSHAEQKLQNIAAGQRASASLSDAAGSAKPQLDAKTLAEMPDEDFAKIWANRKQVRQIIGR